jgi:glutaredoxin 3
MAKIIIYTRASCAYCTHAKHLLDQKGLPYTEIRVDLNPNMLDEMIKLTGHKMIPQILINGEPIGGFDDLYALETSGRLDKIIVT